MTTFTPDQLAVIAVISNPMRYQSRINLYKQFETEMQAAGVTLFTVEIAYGDRPFTVTDAKNPMHVQYRSWSEVWHKENMINLGVQHMRRVRPDIDKFAWIDADLTFVRRDWAVEALHQLEHHNVIQLWSTSVDTGPQGQTFATATSFCSAWLNTQSLPNHPDRYKYFHSGYAWAMRLDAYENLQTVFGTGLLDIAILGSADFYMAWAMVGQLGSHLYQDVASLAHRKVGFQQAYINRLMEWQAAAQKLRSDIGVVEGTVIHHFHGRKKQRQYNTRENILIDNGFNPDTDLRRDAQGVYMLVDHGDARSIRLRDGIRSYMRQRNEDSIDME